jgi:hypothetical protein
MVCLVAGKRSNRKENERNCDSKCWELVGSEFGCVLFQFRVLIPPKFLSNQTEFFYFHALFSNSCDLGSPALVESN